MCYPDTSHCQETALNGDTSPWLLQLIKETLPIKREHEPDRQRKPGWDTTHLHAALLVHLQGPSITRGISWSGNRSQPTSQHYTASMLPQRLPTHPRHSGRRNEPAELGRLGQDWRSPQQAQAVGHLSQHAGATTAPIPGLKMPHPVPAHRQHQQLWGNPCLPCG